MKRPSALVIGLAVLSTGLAAAAIGFAGLAKANPNTLDLNAFQSPSGNIACQIYDQTVRCEIRDRSYAIPPKPAAGCENSAFNGNNITMSPQRAPHFSCASDTVLDSRLPVLAYGATTRAGQITCTSQTAHIACAVDNARWSFQLAREAYRL